MVEFSELENEAINLIRQEGEILQSELWKELDCSAGKGSEIARKLESEGIVDRNRVTSNGASTYMLEANRKKSEDLDFSLLLAGDMLPPFIGGEETEYTDDRFTQWILNLEKEYDV
jgi:DNA-binding Lrp family transcriptional regulator